MKRRTFTPKQKATIVLELLQSHEPLIRTAQKYELSPTVLTRWKDEFLKKASIVFKKDTDELKTEQKIQKYESVIAKLTTQNDFLEKVLHHLE